MFDLRLGDLDAEDTLLAVEENERTLKMAEVRRLELAAHWADLHPGDAVDPHGLPGRERPVQLGGDGTADVADFAAAELGCALQMTAGSTAHVMADALDLRHRLSRTWAAAQAGRMPAYQARRVAAATRHLTKAQAGQVDARLAPRLGGLSYGRLRDLLDGLVYGADPEGADAAAQAAARERFVRLGRTSEHGLRIVMARVTAGDALWLEAIIARMAEILKLDGDLDPVDMRRSKAMGLLAQPAEVLRLLCRHEHDGEDTHDPADEGGTPEKAEDSDVHRSLRIGPPPFDPAKARPRAILYVHLSEEAVTAGRGVARIEGVGPVLLSRLAELLGERTQIVLKPIIDLNAEPSPVDSYEIPDRLAEYLRLQVPSDMFPYAAGGTRGTDIDHTIAYRSLCAGGRPGQTRIGNLGPFVRYHHRIKTHGRWRLRQPEPGSYVWRTPHGRIYLVNATGTHPLGRGQFAKAIWRAAKAPPNQVVSNAVAA